MEVSFVPFYESNDETGGPNLNKLTGGSIKVTLNGLVTFDGKVFRGTGSHKNVPLDGVFDRDVYLQSHWSSLVSFQNINIESLR